MRHGLCAKAFFKPGRDTPVRRPRADKEVPNGPVTDFQAVCLFEMRSDFGPHLTGSTHLTNLFKVIPKRALKRLGVHRRRFPVVRASFGHPLISRLLTHQIRIKKAIGFIR
jgi:hypothetical protein